MEGKKTAFNLDPKHFAKLTASYKYGQTNERTAALVRLALDDFDRNGPVDLKAKKKEKLYNVFFSPTTWARLQALRDAHGGAPLNQILRALLERME